MLKLTHCPHCQTTIQLPDEWMELDRIECPECAQEFSLAEAGVDTAALSDEDLPQHADGLLPAASPRVPSNSPEDEGPTLESLMRSAGGVEANPTDERSETAGEQLFEFGEQSSELDNSDDPQRTVDLGASSTISDLEGLLNSRGDDATPLEIEATHSTHPSQDDESSLGWDRHANDHQDAEDGAAETVNSQSFDESHIPTKVKSSSVKTRARKQRSPSMMRFAIMYIVSTAAAIWLGYLAVLWIQDARDHDNRDPFKMARFYPSAIVPEALSSVDDDQPSQDDPTRPVRPTDREQPGVNDGDTSPRIEAAGFENPISPPEPPEPLPTIQDTPPLPAGDVRVSGAPEFDSDTLTRALEATRPAIAALIEGTLAEAEVRAKQDKAMSYAKVCRLAHVMTFCERPDLQLEQQAQEQVFQQILRYQEHRVDIADLTHLWLTSSKRSYGVFFCGSVVDSVRRGTVFEYTVRLPSGKTLPVIRPERLDASQFADVCILGELVKDPVDVIPGYTGSRKQAIWSSVAFALPPAEKMPEPDPLGGFDLGPPPAFE